MAQIGTMKMRSGGQNKLVRIYSLDDSNITYKGVRVQTPNGVGCLNFVTAGGDIPAVKTQSPSGVRHLKSYAYSQYEDVVYELGLSDLGSINYGPENVTNQGGYTFNLITNEINWRTLPGPPGRVFKISSQCGIRDTTPLGTEFGLWLFNGSSWAFSGASVTPLEYNVEYPVEVTVTEMNLLRTVWIPRYSNTSFSRSSIINKIWYKKNELVYH